MIALQMVRRVCVCRFKVDFRKAHNGLMGCALAAGLNPQDGDLVVFIGRRRDKLKILFRDHNGLLMVYKLFDHASLKGFKFLETSHAQQITFGEVAMLIEGEARLFPIDPST